MVDYLVADNTIVREPNELTAILNDIGAQGWQLSNSYLRRYAQRRNVFVAGNPTTYLVVDWPTGKTPQELEQLLDGYGVDGWVLKNIDLMTQNKRRAIFMQGGSETGGGGIPEAPLDNKTYGRMNATWDWVVSHNDVIDGGDF